MKIDKRVLYRYTCVGPCEKIRHTLKAERAIDGLCTKCKRLEVDKDQLELFGVKKDNG